ncbi:metalloregulator ArsR/SmtB family transcription factor [Arthrobacter sp. I2-34]|uniref:Metalloregulator ArsR/SmtB family transcription factor n=1 Tax=Arthrobacter hankyongi TaxID=2904801 RepID=A0ABS9L5C4_9MICC|nr:metalloregulator ArsR/SmtB family transcription factor [Arthrobacter hankyongi]MCG2621887.1 metalloregulator ArsR/SmtB family transcription factor [Arthrobacter hankyongi]
MDPLADFHVPLYEVKANLFKGLAHPVRIRILELLAASPSVPVAELIAATGQEASNLSQHLSVLRRHHLVDSERRGSQVFYRLAHTQVAELLAVARSLLHEVLDTTRKNLELSAGLPGISGQDERLVEEGRQ